MINIAVVGSGSMGVGIAQVAATAGHQVCLYDNNPDALARAKEQLHRLFDRLVGKAKYTRSEADAILGRLHFVDSLYDCKHVGMLVEAIVENLEAKQSLFEQAEDMLEEDCILATNTSSLSVTAIASACKDPQKVLGLHFFNPAPLMKLVEVVPAVQTGPQVLEAARSLVDSWGKVSVMAKDTPGFIVNRVARPFYGEALRLLEEGLADAPTIDWAMTELGGFRMGPFALMDFIGHDVNYKVTETVFKAFYYDSRYQPSFTQKRLVEAGFLGRKSGRGFYRYDDGASETAAVRDRALGERILRRILLMLINEAAEACYLGIASRDDIDLAMTKGVNYPRGLLRWADELGIDHCVAGMDRLHDEYREERYRCSPLLRRMARQGERFYGRPV